MRASPKKPKKEAPGAIRPKTVKRQKLSLELPDPSKGLGMSLLRAREVVMSTIRPTLRSHKLTDQQWRILRVLGAQSPMNASQLARRTVIQLPSLARIAEELEKRQLVIRHRKTANHPRFTVSITPQGRRLVAKIFPEITEAQRPIRDALGKTTIERLLTIIKAIEDQAVG